MSFISVPLQLEPQTSHCRLILLLPRYRFKVISNTLCAVDEYWANKKKIYKKRWKRNNWI